MARATDSSRTLLLGLCLQVVACAMLAVDDATLTIGYVMATQVLSGIAKDLAKTSAKSYVRTLSPTRSQGSLFALVAALTGSKNAMKGLGFFVGGALLGAVGFRYTNVGLAALLAVAALLGAWAAAARTGQSRGPGQLGVRAPPGDQLAQLCAPVPVRLARRVVRDRAAAVLGAPQLVAHRGRWLPGGLGDRLRTRAGERAAHRAGKRPAARRRLDRPLDSGPAVAAARHRTGGVLRHACGPLGGRRSVPVRRGPLPSPAACTAG